ncbi:hypothetical protein C8Q73DRAFT_714175, partial [Cubamyces lactineus]
MRRLLESLCYMLSTKYRSCSAGATADNHTIDIRASRPCPSCICIYASCTCVICISVVRNILLV